MIARGSRENRFIRRLGRIATPLLLTGFLFAVGLFFSTSPAYEKIGERRIASPTVVGFERFFTGPDADPVAAGEFLLSELRCVKCHLPDRAHGDRFRSHPGPDLEGIAHRVHFDYLAEWLASPAETKPGTTMPHLLTGKSAKGKREAAIALAHYLFSLEGPQASENGLRGSVASGRKLYHTVGCVACHAPEPGFKLPSESGEGATGELNVPSVPLGDIARKYTDAGLREFLIDPLRARPSGHMPRTPLSADEVNDLTAYLLSGDGAPAKPVSVDAGLVAKGEQLFSGLGCVACHKIPGATVPKFKALSELTRSGERGCLSEHPPHGAADYSLSSHQRTALRAALDKNRTPESISEGLQIERRMMALNCFACHQRDSIGGPELARTEYFQTSGEDLEDEGRFPPDLTSAGRKLTPDAIENILRGEDPARPYMTTRMPDFGAQHAAFFREHFAREDLTDDIKPTPRDGREDRVGRAPWGRELTGVTGLNCITCHDLRGEKSLGIRAMDLALAPRRLRPEWFRDFLLDPPKFRPGTRMPSFWPEGKAVHPLIGRNTERQIDSIWVYLNEIDQNRLPEGMEEKGSFELKPKDEPIVFRTFLEGAGLHAIAVGYPEGLHVAFDAEEVRWALAWKGKFLDAESTWDDRSAPPAEPLGTDIFQFPSETFLPDEHLFLGYRLNERGVPIFLYRAGAIEVEDTMEPDAAGKRLRRTLKLNGGSGHLAVRGAGGEKREIEFDADGRATLVEEVSW